MKITAVRSDKIYAKMISSKAEERDDIYRYELMKPFEFKWSCIGMPLKAKEPGGYDVVMACRMNGSYTPVEINNDCRDDVAKISDDHFWQTCEGSIRKALNGFEDNGILLPVQDYVFTVTLSNPDSPMAKMTGDYCGDGGIPGYIIGSIIPKKRSLIMLPVALAHECNHNVRFQFQKWSPNITLGDMIVSEGLAENYAASMFGEDKIGMWASNTDAKTLDHIIKPVMRKNLDEHDFNKLSAFLYGDEIMTIRGGTPIGMPYCAGYACGYQLIRHYLKKTGKTIFEATIIPTAEILKETEDFWD